MAPRVSIRKATPKDLPTLVRHRRAMFRDIRQYPTQALDRADAIYRAWLRARLRSRDAVAFIAVNRSSVPVGSGAAFLRHVDPCPLKSEVVPHIISMFTERTYRSQGIATQILSELIRWCRQEGFAEVSLSPAPRARTLYRRVGFERSWEMTRSLSQAHMPRSKPREG